MGYDATATPTTPRAATTTPAGKKPPKTKTGTVHYMVILDRSGSMEVSRREAIDGFNEQLREIEKVVKTSRKKGASAPVRVWLTLFNHHIAHVHRGAELGTVKYLDTTTYVPEGYTAMLDAVGDALTALREGSSDDDTRIVMVISDGQENSSRTWTYEAIADLIATLSRAGNFSIGYLGSNQDLADLSRRSGISRGSTRDYVSTPAGTRSAMHEASATASSHIEGAVAAASLGHTYSAPDYWDTPAEVTEVPSGNADPRTELGDDNDR